MAHSAPLLAQFLTVGGLLASSLVPAPWLGDLPFRLREAARQNQLNLADYERMERGYYERLLDAGRRLDGPAELAPGRQSLARARALPFDAGPLTLTVNDLREYVLKPNLAFVRHGVTWSTNALGMRDRDYERAKPARTFRIGFVGDSIGSGWGVDDGRGFEPLVESFLDARSRAAGGPAVEVLNFAVPGHAPGQRWEHFTRLGWGFQPDLLVYEATLADPGWDERRLRGLLPRGLGWDAPFYEGALARAGARPGGDFEAYKLTLRNARWDLLSEVYRTIAKDCQSRGVPSVWVLVPRVGKIPEPDAERRLVQLARDSGFTAVADFSNAFDGLDPERLRIDVNDYHPNADGHARLARRLEEFLGGVPAIEALWSRAAGLEGGTR